MQSVTIAAQTQMFLLACGFGFLLGLLYDVFRIFRMAFFKQKAVVFAQDVLYFALCGCLTFLFCLTMNYGEIRGYVLLGEVLGWIVYYFSLGAMVFQASSAVVGVLNKAARFVLLALSAPFRFVFRAFRKITGFFAVLLKKTAEKFHINFRIALQPHGGLLYNHNKPKIRLKAGYHRDEENESVQKKKKKHHT